VAIVLCTQMSASAEQNAPPGKPTMTVEVVEHAAFKVVGVELADAELRPYLITYAWAALCPKMPLIKHQTQPYLLYGLWYRKPGAEKHSYLVGVEVYPRRLRTHRSPGATSAPSGRIPSVLRLLHACRGSSANFHFGVFLTFAGITQFKDVPAGMVTCAVSASKFARVTHRGRIGNIPYTYRVVTE